MLLKNRASNPDVIAKWVFWSPKSGRGWLSLIGLEQAEAENETASSLFGQTKKGEIEAN